MLVPDSWFLIRAGFLDICLQKERQKSPHPLHFNPQYHHRHRRQHRRQTPMRLWTWRSPRRALERAFIVFPWGCMAWVSSLQLPRLLNCCPQASWCRGPSSHTERSFRRIWARCPHQQASSLNKVQRLINSFSETKHTLFHFIQTSWTLSDFPRPRLEFRGLRREAEVMYTSPESEGHYVAGKLGLPSSPGMTQGKEGLISPDKHHPHFPLHMYALSGSHLASSKSHRDEPSFSSGKEEADLVTCQSKSRRTEMLRVQTVVSYFLEVLCTPS